MQAKLTLSIDPDVVANAKKYAAEAGISLSQLVEGYLVALAAPSAPPETPVLARWRGALRGVDPQDYRDHLAKKYG